MKSIQAPVSIGELIDKITILEIKVEKLEREAQKNAAKELDFLNQVLIREKIKVEVELFQKLKSVNIKLWEIEEKIRNHEKSNEFGDDFINLARAVYIQNDLRASIKREINIKLNSELIEEKSYPDYTI